VSTAPEHKEDVRRAAMFVADEMRRIGLENVDVIPTKNHRCHSTGCGAGLTRSMYVSTAPWLEHRTVVLGGDHIDILQSDTAHLVATNMAARRTSSLCSGAVLTLGMRRRSFNSPKNFC